MCIRDRAGLAHADLPRAIQVAAQLLAEEPRGANPVPVVEAIVQQRNGGRMLSESLEEVELHPAVMASLSEFHRDTGLLPAPLAEIFQPSQKPGSLTADLLAEDQQSLTADVEQYGNAARGESIYRRRALSCTNCHAIGPAGPAIGPNLVAVGAAAKTGYMVESILKPNAAIAEHYENKSFVLESGIVQTGIVTFRNEKEVIVRDSAKLGMEVRIDAAEIEQELPAPSLMPAGLADQLRSRAELLDLVKFISVL